MSVANEHGVFPADEILFLPRKKKGWRGCNVAEIWLAQCDDGWRSSISFQFHGGDWWGHGSPIYVRDPAYPTRGEAIEAGKAQMARNIERLRADGNAEAKLIFDWMDSLSPVQPDLFGAAA